MRPATLALATLLVITLLAGCAGNAAAGPASPAGTKSLSDPVTANNDLKACAAAHRALDAIRETHDSIGRVEFSTTLVAFMKARTDLSKAVMVANGPAAAELNAMDDEMPTHPVLLEMHIATGEFDVTDAMAACSAAGYTWV